MIKTTKMLLAPRFRSFVVDRVKPVGECVTPVGNTPDFTTRKEDISEFEKCHTTLLKMESVKNIQKRFLVLLKGQ